VTTRHEPSAKQQQPHDQQQQTFMLVLVLLEQRTTSLHSPLSRRRVSVAVCCDFGRQFLASKSLFLLAVGA